MHPEETSAAARQAQILAELAVLIPRINEAFGLAYDARQMAELAALAPLTPERAFPLNHLDIGNWVPVDNSGAGLAIANFGSTYTKHERLVIARAVIQYPVTASGAAAAISLSHVTAAMTSGYIDYSTSGLMFYCSPNVGVAQAQFYNLAGAVMTNAALSNLVIGATFVFLTP